MTAPRVEASSDGRGARVFVRAQPGAKRAGVAGLWNEYLKVAVRAPAEDGRANEELARVLAEALGLKNSAVQLVRGERARLKEFLVACPAEQVRERLLSLVR